MPGPELMLCERFAFLCELVIFCLYVALTLFIMSHFAGYITVEKFLGVKWKNKLVKLFDFTAFITIVDKTNAEQ